MGSPILLSSLRTSSLNTTPPRPKFPDTPNPKIQYFCTCSHIPHILIQAPESFLETEKSKLAHRQDSRPNPSRRLLWANRQNFKGVLKPQIFAFKKDFNTQQFFFACYNLSINSEQYSWGGSQSRFKCTLWALGLPSEVLGMIRSRALSFADVWIPCLRA